jgi:hypothetical protein
MITFNGAPTATLATAFATSSAAIGWMSTDGMWTSWSCVGHALREFKELSRMDDRVRHRGFLDQPHLRGLCVEVADFRRTVGSDYREGDVVCGAGRSFVRKEITG